MGSMGSVTWGCAIAVAAVVGGCAHNPPPPPQTGSITQTTTTSAPTAAAAVPQRNVVVSEDLLTACKIDLNNEAKAPKFDFDQTGIRSEDRGVLDQVAQCVTTGPLKGRSLHLVGRADPRGEQEYNMVLGSSRAEAVATYLESLGVPKTQLRETSRGKLDARGTDDASWQLDRRVDLD